MNEAGNSAQENAVGAGNPASGGLRNALVFASIGLFAAIVFGILWFFFLAPTLPGGTFGWFLFAFAAGLTMIVLPCTLPLAFVIVPLSMGRGILKGLGMALSFGIGVAATLSLYGVAAAALGSIAIDALGAPLEAIKNWVYFIAGIFALVFALGEIKLLKLRMPSYSGAAPSFIQRRQDYLKAFLLGLFLGNIGVGCPHPATPLILIEAASSGNILYGWLLFLVHAVGRILPLLLLAFLGILGVNGLNWLVARKDKVERATGWAMIFVAGFILTLGLFTHDWWVNSGIHSQLEKLTQEERLIGIVSERLDSEVVHRHGPEEGEGLFGLPLGLGNWFLVAVWLVPLWWWFLRQRRRVKQIPGEEKVGAQEAERKLLFARGFGFAALSLLLAFIFIYYLPHTFLQHEAFIDDHDEVVEEMVEHMDEADGHDDVYRALPLRGFFEESEITDGLVVNFTHIPDIATSGEPVLLRFFVNEKPSGTPVVDLELEHEKFIHVIGMREDLNEFFHIHPELAEEAGVWEIEHILRAPGDYYLWSDVFRDGNVFSFKHAPMTVLGDGVRSEKKIDFLENVIIDDNYQVTFQHNPLIAGRTEEFSFIVSDIFGGGIPLEPYLGADMHAAVVKDDLSTYLHTHPHSDDEDDHSYESLLLKKALAHGTESGLPPAGIPFEVVFPSSGVYKLFAQFRPAGIDLPPDESLVAEFYAEVEEKTDFSSPVRNEEPRLSWWQKPIWWILFVASLALAGVLSFGVYKYLED